MKRIIMAAGLAGGMVLATTACVPPFYHSDRTLITCGGPLGWGSKACGDSLCYDFSLAYPGQLCPIEVEYASGPR